MIYFVSPAMINSLGKNQSKQALSLSSESCSRATWPRATALVPTPARERMLVSFRNLISASQISWRVRKVKLCSQAPLNFLFKLKLVQDHTKKIVSLISMLVAIAKDKTELFIRPLLQPSFVKKPLHCWMWNGLSGISLAWETFSRVGVSEEAQQMWAGQQRQQNFRALWSGTALSWETGRSSNCWLTKMF